MKPFQYEKLVRIHGLRLDVALAAVRETQASVGTHEKNCAALQLRKQTLQTERRRQRDLLLAAPFDSHTAQKLCQGELNSGLLAHRLEQLDAEFERAQQALDDANEALAAKLRDYHRVRTKRDRLEERQAQWRREQQRAAARHEEQELDEICCSNGR